MKLAGTFVGVDLSWNPPADANENGVADYVIHRVVDGVDTTFPWVPDPYSTAHRWHESERIPGATYAVAGVNAEGEGPASEPIAAPPTREAITVGYSARQEDGSAPINAGQVALAGATQIVPFAADGPTRVIGYDVAASPDGLEIAFAKGQNSLWRVRADVPHAEPVMLLDGSTGIIRMAWSPDGTRIAFERLQPDSSSCVEIIGAAGGTPIRVGCNILMPTWMPDSRTLLVKNRSSNVLQRIEAKADGAVLGTYAGTEQSILPTVSPDGRWIGYISGTAPAVIPIGGGTPKLGQASQLTPSSISWSPDGTRLLLNKSIAYGGSALWVLPVAPDGTPGTGESVFLSQWTENIGSAVWQGPRVMIKPTPAVMGSSLSVPFDTTGLATPATVTCQLDGSAAAPCTSPYVKSGVPAGSHVLQVTAIEADGRTTVASRAFTVDTTAPSPASPVQAST